MFRYLALSLLATLSTALLPAHELRFEGQILCDSSADLQQLLHYLEAPSSDAPESAEMIYLHKLMQGNTPQCSGWKLTVDQYNIYQWLSTNSPSYPMESLDFVYSDEIDEIENALADLLIAISQDDYEAFLERCTPELQEKLTSEDFAKLTAHKIKTFQSYCSYLGAFEQEGSMKTLWKFTTKNQSDKLITLITDQDLLANGLWIE